MHCLVLLVLLLRPRKAADETRGDTPSKPYTNPHRAVADVTAPAQQQSRRVHTHRGAHGDTQPPPVAPLASAATQGLAPGHPHQADTQSCTSATQHGCPTAHQQLFQVSRGQQPRRQPKDTARCAFCPNSSTSHQLQTHTHTTPPPPDMPRPAYGSVPSRMHAVHGSRGQPAPLAAASQEGQQPLAAIGPRLPSPPLAGDVSAVKRNGSQGLSAHKAQVPRAPARKAWRAGNASAACCCCRPTPHPVDRQGSCSSTWQHRCLAMRTYCITKYTRGSTRQVHSSCWCPGQRPVRAGTVTPAQCVTICAAEGSPCGGRAGPSKLLPARNILLPYHDPVHATAAPTNHHEWMGTQPCTTPICMVHTAHTMPPPTQHPRWLPPHTNPSQAHHKKHTAVWSAAGSCSKP